MFGVRTRERIFSGAFSPGEDSCSWRRASGEGLMRLTVIALALCVSSAGLAFAQDAKVKRGEQVYTEQKCGMCHSIGEKGNKKGPLDGVGTKLNAKELRDWVVDAKGMTEKTKAARKPFMKNYELPKDDVDALVAYMQTLKK
jgi:mono/diheme cytochrome c family protein